MAPGPMLAAIAYDAAATGLSGRGCQAQSWSSADEWDVCVEVRELQAMRMY
jgi:hypothetical protein